MKLIKNYKNTLQDISNIMINYDFSHYYISIIMRSKKAGKAIAAGSFGCVFKPPIKCADGSKGYEKGVSKLLTNKNAEEEIKTINNVMPILSKIPNNKMYFIPNSEMPFLKCKIGEFSEEDLENSTVCRNLEYIRNLKGYNKNLTDVEIEKAKNFIRDNKDYFTIIQQEDGGISLHKYIREIDKSDVTIDFLQKLNKNICDLIKNGVVKMNQEGLLHLDLKPDNMVIEPSLPLIRIIDWGMARQVNNYNNFSNLKDNLFSSSIMFNVPPSSILFNKGVINYINESYDGKNIDFIKNKFYQSYFDKNDLHKNDFHSEILLNLIDILGKHAGNAANNWATFLAMVITKYTKDSKFDAFKYFEEVYRHNVDIYSVLLTYVFFIYYEKIPTKYLSGLKDICYRYMFSREIAITKIDVNKLTEELDNLFGKPAKSEIKMVAQASPVSSKTRTKKEKVEEEKKITGTTPLPINTISKKVNSTKRAGPTPNILANQVTAIFDNFFGGKSKKTKTTKHKRKTRKHKRKTT